MRKTPYLLVLVLAFLAGLLGAYIGPKIFAKSPVSSDEKAAISSKESAYDRVMRTGTIRCGYSVYPPYFLKDPATGEMSGIWHDLIEAMGNHLGLKVTWAEEIGLGDMGVALDSNRIDIYCGGIWTAGKRVRVVDFLNPSAFEPIFVYVRADDHRFDDNLALLNDPNVTVSTIDGEGGALIAADDFPKTKNASLTQMSNYSDMFNQVVAKKADFVMSAPSGAAVFLKSNPGVLRPLSKPVRMFAVAFTIKYGEDKWRDMLNQAQADVVTNGAMEKILSKYEVNKGNFWRVAPPYIPQ